MSGTATDVKRAPLSLDEQVRERAHQIFMERGGQDGSDWDDWLEAEEEILSARRPAESD